MCTIYGYCRISRKSQNIERQKRNIKAVYPHAVLVCEAYTGTKTEGRKEFEKLIGKVKTGDTIIFDSVSRMSRNADEGFTLYKQLFESGINLVFLKEPHINTDTYKQARDKSIPLTGTAVDHILKGVNEYLLELAKEQIKLAFEQAEKEVSDLHQRTREGIETARLNGKQIGGVAGRKLTTKKSVEMKEKIRKMSKNFDGNMKDNEVIDILHIARNSYYKYKKEMKMEKKSKSYNGPPVKTTISNFIVNQIFPILTLAASRATPHI